MRTSSIAAMIAVLSVASYAAARSWIVSTVVGTIVPGTVRCGDQGCAATVRAERLVTHTFGEAGGWGELDVTIDPAAVLGDRDGTASWPDLRSALLGFGAARLRLVGDLDILDGRLVLLHTRSVVRMRVLPPQAGAPAPVLFPACGALPWTQDTLERCAATERSRPVTVTATLESDAAPAGDGDWSAALQIEDVTVQGAGGASALRVPYETAFVKKSGWLLDPGSKRGKLLALRAGDRLTLTGAYELPLPRKAEHAQGWHCRQDRCEPRLVVQQVTLNAP